MNHQQAVNEQQNESLDQQLDQAISAESFAEASVEAQMAMQEELAGRGQVDQATMDKVWKKHFENTKFFKSYKAHMERKNFLKLAQKKKQELFNKMNKDYIELEEKYHKLQQEAEHNKNIGQHDAEEFLKKNEPKDLMQKTYNYWRSNVDKKAPKK